MVLGVADLRTHAARRKIVRGQAELREGALDGGRLIVVIVDGKIARDAEMVRLAAQQARAEGMKRGNPYVGGVAAARAQQVADALLHHTGGFVREGDRQDGAGRDAHFDEMRHAIGNHARLARPGAGHDHERAFGGQHSFALALVQIGKERGSFGGLGHARILTDGVESGNLRFLSGARPSGKTLLQSGDSCATSTEHEPTQAATLAREIRRWNGRRRIVRRGLPRFIGSFVSVRDGRPGDRTLAAESGAHALLRRDGGSGFSRRLPSGFICWRRRAARNFSAGAPARTP